MKTITFGVFLMATLFFLTSAMGQKSEPSKEQKAKAKQSLETYFEELDLDGEQKNRYEEIIIKYGNQLDLVQNSGAKREDKLKAVQEIQERKDAEMKAFLSEEQYALYLEQKERRRQMLLENRSGEFAEYRERLNLTGEQQPQFIETSRRYGQQLKGLKDSEKSRLSKYREYKAINKSKNREMKALLTSEQYKVYLEVQKEIQKKIMEKRKQ